MNDDLISRSELLEKMSELNGWDEYNQGVGDCHRLVDFAPAVDAEPEKHSHWTTHGGETYCAACGEEAGSEYGRYTYIESEYCPSCGAKMDGGNDE